MGFKEKWNIPAITAEFVGTFFIVFFSSYYNIVDETTRSNGIAILMLYTFFTYSIGPISGAHFNPAITMSLMLQENFGWLKGAFYIAAQLLASLIAGFFILVLKIKGESTKNQYWLGEPTILPFPGTTEPTISYFSLFFSETLCTAFLLFFWNIAMNDE